MNTFERASAIRKGIIDIITDSLDGIYLIEGQFRITGCITQHNENSKYSPFITILISTDNIELYDDISFKMDLKKYYYEDPECFNKLYSDIMVLYENACEKINMA